MIEHPNRVRVKGIALPLGVVSDHAHNILPEGDVASGARVVVPVALAEALAHSLLGVSLTALTQPIEVKGQQYEPFTINAPRMVVGYISAVNVEDNCLHFEGVIFGKDFPEVPAALRAQPMGCCAILDHAHFENIDGGIRRMTAGIITSVAILLTRELAFQTTCIELAG